MQGDAVLRDKLGHDILRLGIIAEYGNKIKYSYGFYLKIGKAELCSPTLIGLIDMAIKTLKKHV